MALSTCICHGFGLQRAVELEQHSPTALRFGREQARARAHARARLDRCDDPSAVEKTGEFRQVVGAAARGGAKTAGRGTFALDCRPPPPPFWILKFASKPLPQMPRFFQS